MTDRIHSLTVVLDEDIRDDDIQGLISALSHFRHVIDVQTNVTDPISLMAEARARNQLTERILAALRLK